MKSTLILVTNNAENAPFLYSQLLDIYESDNINFDEYHVFAGNLTGKKIAYAQAINNGLGLSTPLRYFIFYKNLFLTLFKSREDKVLVHLRGFVGAIIFFFIPKFFLKNISYIYDPRGAFLTEQKEAKGNNYILKQLSIIEKRLIKNSIFTVVTTNRFKDLFVDLYGFKDKYVVCYNATSFLGSDYNTNLIEKETVNICYCGSINYWHDLDEIHRLIMHVKSLFTKSKVYFFTSKKNHEKVKKKFSDLGNDELVTDFVDYNNLESELNKMDICISVVKPTTSTEIASPIKISDYVMLEKYIIANKGIGDFDDFFIKNNSSLLYEYKSELNFKKSDIIALKPEKNKEIQDKVSIHRNRIIFYDQLKSKNIL